MPRLVLPVLNTAESVSRPVVVGVVRDLMEITGIPADSVILFPGEHEKAQQKGSSVTASPELNAANFTSKVTINVEEDYEEDRILSSAVFRPEELFVFRDDRIQTSIKPAYSSTEMAVNFRYRSLDRQEAIRWRDELKNRTSMQATERLHSLTYHYLIPEVALAILKEIHRLRENVAPYGEDYETFFKANSSQRVSQLANMSGQQTAWGVSETQARVVGWFDFTGRPEVGQKSDEGDTWTIDVTYRFRFDRPTACVMQYPLVIHNQVLSPNYRPTADDNVKRLEDHQTSYSLSAANFRHFDKTRAALPTMSQARGIAIPDFDEFLPNDIIIDTLRIFTILVTIDDEHPLGPSFLFNLKDIGSRWDLHPSLFCYLNKASTQAKIVKPHVAPLILSLYQDRDLVGGVALRVDSDLNVFATVPLSKRRYYHVRLALDRNISGMDLTDLRNCGEACRILMLVLGVDVTPCMLSTGYVGASCLANLVNKGNGQIYQFNTVESLFITADRKNQ